MTLIKIKNKIGKTRQKQKQILNKMIAKNSDIQYLINALDLDIIQTSKFNKNEHSNNLR
jgi:hypothetical protein